MTIYPHMFLTFPTINDNDKIKESNFNVLYQTNKHQSSRLTN